LSNHESMTSALRRASLSPLGAGMTGSRAGRVWGLVARQAAKEARSALRNVLGTLRGEDTR